MPFPPFVAKAISSFIGGSQVRERSATLHFSDAGHGYDQFGLHPDFVALGDSIAKPLYDRYFRVTSTGTEHIPATGGAILAANHSGILPFDGAMLWADVLRNTDPPRIPRPVADYFVSSLPFISTLFARCGVVGGSRGNARALLESGELLMLFPEGTPGIIKSYAQRYRLQEWRKGHCELAIRHGAPVIPVGIIGAEEQMPSLAQIPLTPGYPLPHIPIPATPLPLPVRYRIYYGEPIALHTRHSPEDADNPELVQQAADEVKETVQALLDRGLQERKTIF